MPCLACPDPTRCDRAGICQGLSLTARQHQVLAYLRVFLAVNHQLPPLAKIAADFGWKSPHAAHSILKRLERDGALQRNELGNLMLTPAGLALEA